MSGLYLAEKQIQQIEVADAEEKINKSEHSNGADDMFWPSKDPAGRFDHSNWQQV